MALGTQICHPKSWRTWGAMRSLEITWRMCLFHFHMNLPWMHFPPSSHARNVENDQM
ncbi:hypothetical protein SCA6_002208 [Theobroma cacao]